MRKEKKRQDLLLVFGAVLAGAIGVGLLTDAAAVGQGIRDGLAVCGNVLIPSLFAFMALAVFLSRTEFGRILSLPLTPITTKIYKLPKELGVVVLLSLIGGYPVGARMIAGLLEEGRISAKTASRMLCFCVNSGPSFVISAVGVGMLMNKTAGVILFATQTLATLLIGAAVSLRAVPDKEGTVKAKQAGGADVFVSSVTGASSSMLVMCAFAVLFSGILALLRSSGVVSVVASLLPVNEQVVNAVFCGLLEVTTGCLAATKLGGWAGFALLSVFVSFSGLSVLFQVMSCFQPRQVRFKPLILTRLVHCMLSTCMALPLYRAMPAEQAVWLSTAPPILQAGSGKAWIITICLLAMCSILVLTAEKYNR